MHIVILIILAIAGLWYFSMIRGRLSVRAAAYLLALENGASPQEANRFALSIDMYEAAKRKNEVMYCVQQVYGGSQLALISEARLMGFIG